jgi:gluconolactonase
MLLGDRSSRLAAAWSALFGVSSWEVAMFAQRCLAAACAVVSCCVAVGVWAGEPIEGVGPAGKIEKVEGQYEFTEGPVWIKDSLYFTDIPKERIYKLGPDGLVSVFREASRHANGLFGHASGEIYACQMDGRLAAISADGKEERVLAEKYMDQRFNAPNDLVIDRGGGVYFTDPAFRAPMPLPQMKTCVYYYSPDGTVTRLIEDLPNPNGVILSPDEKTLYVIPSGQTEMMAYDVESAGKVKGARTFCTLKQPPNSPPSGGDGLTVDTKGNLYITSKLGLQVFTPDGKMLGVIETPEQPANVTFGGKDSKTLYVTARKSVYAIPMHAQGHQFPAGKN